MKPHFPAKSRKFQIGEKVSTEKGVGEYIGCYYTINEPDTIKHPQIQHYVDGTSEIVIREYPNYERTSFKNYHYQVKFDDGKVLVFNQIRKGENNV